MKNERRRRKRCSTERSRRRFFFQTRSRWPEERRSLLELSSADEVEGAAVGGQLEIDEWQCTR